MAGAYLAYRNLFTEALYDVAVGVDTTEDTDFPLSNLYIRQLSKVARFTSPSEVSLEITKVGTAEECNLIAFMGENAPIEILVNGTDSYSQFFVESEEMDAVLPRITIFCIPLTFIDSIVTVHPGVTSGEVARVYMAKAIYLEKGVDASWGMSMQDNGDLEASDGKQFYEDAGVRLRKLSFACTVLTEQLAYGITTGSPYATSNSHFQAMQFYAGTTSEVVIVPRSETPMDIRRMAIYGHVENEFTINHNSGIYYSCSLTALEER